jgi:tetratricopeptide (TPR) repeat protein
MGINYHDVSLKLNGNRPTITDMYIMLSGETLSSTFRRGILPVIAHENRGMLDRLLEEESAYIKNINPILTFIQAAQRGQVREAIRIFNALPAELHKNQNLLIILLQGTAQKLLEKDPIFVQTYETNMKRYRRLFPKQANIDFLLIDYHATRKEFDKSLAAVERLDKKVKDPYLDHLRGNLYHQLQDPTQAKNYFSKVIRYDSTLPDPQYSLLTVVLEEKEFKKATQIMIKMKKTLDVVFPEMEKHPLFNGYIASAEYPKYQAFLTALQQ